MFGFNMPVGIPVIRSAHLTSAKKSEKEETGTVRKSSKKRRKSRRA